MKTDRLRVLIVDDSAVIRGLMARALAADPQIDVVGTAMHGEAALSWLNSNTADVVVLDVEMPVLDGLETLRRIQQMQRVPKVIMASSLTYSGARTSLRALSAGAAACVAKPQAGSAAAAIEAVGRDLIPLIHELMGSKRVMAGSVAVPPPVATPQRISRPEPAIAPDLVVIGASTGGPNALSQVLCDLGPGFETPTLIVQHMPPMFTAILASRLQTDTGRTVREAAHGERVEAGCTYVAPGCYHMELRRDHLGLFLELHQGPEEHYCRPSVNPLFRSVASVVGKRVVAVMLTGMGSDGIEGTADLVQAGAYVLAQNEATSVVWGMPGAVVSRGLADEVLPLQEIGPRIQRICARTNRINRTVCR